MVSARWLGPILLTIIPVAGRKEILSQFNLMETGGGQLAVEKMLTRLRRKYWWPTMKTDIERKVQWCQSRSVHMKEMKMKRAEGLAPVDPGIRFRAVAVDILGPVTMATSSRAKHVLVFTELFTMYTNTVPLVSTKFFWRGSWDSGELGAEVRSSQCATYRSRKKFWWQKLWWLRFLPSSRRVMDRQKDTTRRCLMLF